MDIEQIRKEMTREEFVNEILKGSSGKLKTRHNCPNHYSLEVGKNNKCELKCKDCWLNAIKNIKFKGEDAKMKLWEVLKEENLGKRFKDSKGREFKLYINEDEELYLTERGYFDAKVFTQNEIMTLGFEEIKQKVTGWEEIKQKVTGWEDVEEGQGYNFISAKGTIEFIHNENDRTDKECKKNLNQFSAKEKAKQVAKAQLLYRKMLKFYDENDGQVDWNNKDSFKYHINFNNKNKDFDIYSTMCLREVNSVCFSSTELVQRCIDEVIKPFIEEFGGLE